MAGTDPGPCIFDHGNHRILKYRVGGEWVCEKCRLNLATQKIVDAAREVSRLWSNSDEPVDKALDRLAEACGD